MDFSERHAKRMGREHEQPEPVNPVHNRWADTFDLEPKRVEAEVTNDEGDEERDPPHDVLNPDDNDDKLRGLDWGWDKDPPGVMDEYDRDRRKYRGYGHYPVRGMAVKLAKDVWIRSNDLYAVRNGNEEDGFIKIPRGSTGIVNNVLPGFDRRTKAVQVKFGPHQEAVFAVGRGHADPRKFLKRARLAQRTIDELLQYWEGTEGPEEPGERAQPKEHKDFKVAAVSENRNAFGLFGMIVIARDGEAWQLAANDLLVKQYPQGSVIRVLSLPGAAPHFPALGFEIPTRQPDAPGNVVAQVWGTAARKAQRDTGQIVINLPEEMFPGEPEVLIDYQISEGERPSRYSPGQPPHVEFLNWQIEGGRREPEGFEDWLYEESGVTEQIFEEEAERMQAVQEAYGQKRQGQADKYYQQQQVEFQVPPAQAAQFTSSMVPGTVVQVESPGKYRIQVPGEGAAGGLPTEILAVDDTYAEADAANYAKIQGPLSVPGQDTGQPGEITSQPGQAPAQPGQVARKRLH